MAFPPIISPFDILTMDFQSILDFVSTVGYDVDFMRGDILDLLATKVIEQGEGVEHFEPRSAPRGALAATGPWAARLLQGGGTFVDELAGGTTWCGSLDLPGSARRVSEIVRGWMEVEVSSQANLISSAGNGFPVGATTAEQFYSLRDSIHYLEQWLPGPASSHPALTLLMAFGVGVDEFFCPLDSLDSTVYLGRQLNDLWEECLVECDSREDAACWLTLARDALRVSVFLQNREKLAHLGLVTKDKEVFTDWDTTANYMLRADAAMVPFTGFCLCAYSGLPFRAELAGTVGIYCYANAFVLDFCKRSTRLGGGNYTEVALNAHSSELQGRSHLISAVLAYGEEVLPSIFLSVLRPFVLSTSSMVDVLDRYRERSWGQRLPLGWSTLQMMKSVMEAAGGYLGDSITQASPRNNQLLAEIIEESDAWDSYNAYAHQPSVDGLYRLPRAVRIALQLGTKSCGPSATNGRSSNPSLSWLECLC